MMRLRLWLALLVLSATLTQCSKCKENVTPDTPLPPETQVGANTFGCLLNGKKWIPTQDGHLNYFRTLSIWYDPTYAGGSFSIKANINHGITTDEFIGLSVDSITLNPQKIYLIGNKRINAGIGYINYAKDTSLNQSCDFDYGYRTDKKYLITGIINLKKLDTKIGIASGTFEFTAYVEGCDTLKVTDGRFDIKLF